MGQVEEAFDNRITIFRHLTVDELTQTVKQSVFEQLLDANYDRFVHFCEEIEELKDRVKAISCFIEDGELSFHIEYKTTDVN